MISAIDMTVFYIILGIAVFSHIISVVLYLKMRRYKILLEQYTSQNNDSASLTSPYKPPRAVMRAINQLKGKGKSGTTIS